MQNDDSGTAAKAADWYLLIRSEDCTEGDRAAFKAWLESNPEHKRAYSKILRIWSLSEQLAPVAAKPALRPAPQMSHRQRLAAAASVWRRATPRMAAAVFLLVPLGYGGWLLNWLPNDYHRYSAEQARRPATLPDGSHVEMNLNTRISYANYRDRRQVTIRGDGEAFFEVSHDSAHPFEIAAGTGTITVTGTAFNVWKYQGHVVVAVKEGSVRVSNNSSDANLRPGLQAKYNEHRTDPQVGNADLDQALAWRSGKLILDNLTLAEAILQINRYLEYPIVLADESVAELRIGGIYDTHNMAGLVAKLPNALPIVMHQSPDGTITLSRR